MLIMYTAMCSSSPSRRRTSDGKARGYDIFVIILILPLYSWNPARPLAPAHCTLCTLPPATLSGSLRAHRPGGFCAMLGALTSVLARECRTAVTGRAAGALFAGENNYNISNKRPLATSFAGFCS